MKHDDASLVGPTADPDVDRPGLLPRRVPTGARRREVVAVMGLGHLGLPLSLALVAAGVEVIGLDGDVAHLAAVEAGLVDLSAVDRRRLPAAVRARHLVIATDPDRIRAADTVVICVPAPMDGSRLPDPVPVAAACASVVGRARFGQLIVLAATSYAGATRDLLIEPLARRGLRAGRDLHVAAAPVGLDGGSSQLPHNHGPALVGGATESCGQQAARLIERVAGVAHLVASPEVAELAVLYESTLRAVNASVANELADLCEAAGVDPIQVIDAAATEPAALGPAYPGAGTGVHGIPAGPYHLLWQLRHRAIDLPVVTQAMASLASRPARTADRVFDALVGAGIAVRGSRVLVAGVGGAPGAPPVRPSPALGIMRRLSGFGVDVAYHDPLIEELDLGGRRLRSVPARPGQCFDAVVIHAPAPGLDPDLFAAPIRIDCTYRHPPRSRPAGPAAGRPT